LFAVAQTPEALRRIVGFGEPMLEYAILKPEGILVLQPSESLSEEDFVRLSASVDAYLADHASIHGVLIHAKAFPGWENFAGFTAHMLFVRNHHQKIERVALVTDSPVARVAEALAKHFIAAEIKHFPFAGYEKALNWLKTAGAGPT
jgi:SpoIIAA-like